MVKLMGMNQLMWRNLGSLGGPNGVDEPNHQGLLCIVVVGKQL